MIYVLSGGAPLNFKVLGGTTEPANPKENTIWVNTSTAITSWVFSATQPTSPVNGMVWLRTDNRSSVAFNALEKNELQVYPIAAKQYISGAWKTVDCKTYQGGVGKGFQVYLFKDGAFIDGIDPHYYKNAAIDSSNGYLKLWSSTVTASSDYALVFTRERFDFSPYTQLHWRVRTAESYSNYPGTAVGLCPNGWATTGSHGSWDALALSTSTSSEWQEFVLDISNVNQFCHIQVGGYTRAYVESIWVQ